MKVDTYNYNQVSVIEINPTVLRIFLSKGNPSIVIGSKPTSLRAFLS